MNKYRVRFTDRASGNTHTEFYPTARRAKEVVELTATRHRAANTDAEYLGAVR